MVDAADQKQTQQRVCSRNFFNDFSVRPSLSDFVCNTCVDAFFDADYTSKIKAGVAELADAPDSKSGSERSVGSTPTARTTPCTAHALAWSLRDRAPADC